MTQKTVWQTDRNGFYLGESQADESPLRAGDWLIPAGCVEVPPPPPVDGKVPRWNGKRWKLVEAPAAAAEPSPQEKLAQFLALNPDVQALVAGVAADNG